ncbi:MAG: pyruvate kinase, partial [Aedoeadaptatus pacaensis]
MKKTKIVATIGPASWDEATLRELFSAGVNVCRLNFSHGDYKSHKQTMDRIKKVREEMNLPIAIMLDTKGPEIRTVTFKGGEATLREGADFALYALEREGDEAGVAITYGELYKDVAPGQMILMDDGLLALEVESIEGTTIHTKVLNGGVIKDHKGINVPGASIQLPALTEKDVADIRFGIEEGVDFIAASFIRKKDDLLAIRDVLESNGGEGIKVIAKIENKEGIDNMDAIASFADGIMVARGDMGVEIETERVPLVQKQLIERAIDEGIPVITA